MSETFDGMEKKNDFFSAKQKQAEADIEDKIGELYDSIEMKTTELKELPFRSGQRIERKQNCCAGLPRPFRRR